MAGEAADANVKAAGGRWITQMPMPAHVCSPPLIPYASELGTGSVWECRCGKQWHLTRDQYAVYKYEEVE